MAATDEVVRYEYRDYLLRTVGHTQGFLSDQRASSVREDGLDPQQYISSLAVQIETLSHSECAGDSYVATAARIYAGFKADKQAKAVLLLAVPWRGAYIRTIGKRFQTWKTCEGLPVPEPFEIVKVPSAPGDHSHVGVSADTSEIAVAVLPPEPSSEEMDLEDVQLPQPRYAQPPIHQRLYNEASRKRLLIVQYEQARQAGDLKECTFRPDTMQPRSVPAGDIHARLYQEIEDSKAREQVYLRRRMEQEMSECTFSPKLDHGKEQELKAKTLSFTRLYEEAERKRAKMRLSDAANAQAEAISPRTAVSGKIDAQIYEKLFNASTSQAKKIRKQQLAKDQKESQNATFSPRINPRKDAVPAAASVYQRLYELNDVQLKKLAQKRESQSLVYLPEKKQNEETQDDGAGPRYELLYQKGMEKPQRQAILQAKYDSEQGISFTPRTNVGSGQSTARSGKASLKHKRLSR